MSEQSRRPAGSPGGGQFGEVLRRESLADLEIDDGLGWDGSFHAVPQFSTATQVYNFFTEHAPPDLTVFKLRRIVNERSADDAEQRWKADFDRRSSRWDAENPAPDRGGRRSAALEAHQRRRDEFLASLEQSMGESGDYAPDRIGPHEAFRATVALGRWNAGRLLPTEERVLLGNRPSGWTDEVGRAISIETLVNAYRLDEIADTVLDPESDQREMMELLREIRRVQGLTAHSSHQAAVALQDMAYYEDPR